MRVLDLSHFDPGGDQVPTLITRDEAEQSDPSRWFRYAILSHRWLREEVTFEDLKQGTAQYRAGYEKLLQSIRLAHQGRHKYLWMDTCCINKDSSAELSEAINSMYQWYQKAEVCYAYLHDVDTIDRLGRSDWFTRGWTLQELLAPKRIVFYNRDWKYLSDRASLGPQISEVTKVPLDILDGSRTLESMSVAARMSWAVGRKTTRIEDIAYSLMGIFSVNMPLLYGEGSKAFTRLQTEIMNQSDDFSLFAWKRQTAPIDEQHGLLADSPDDFRFSSDIVTYQEWRDFSTFAMTSKGLQIRLGVSNDRAILPCSYAGKEDGFLAIYIAKVPGSRNQFARARLSLLDAMYHEGNPEDMYFPQSVSSVGRRPAAYHRIRLSISRDVSALYKPKKVILSRGSLLDGPTPDTKFATIIDSPLGRSQYAINVTTMRSRIGLVILFENRSAKSWMPAPTWVLLIGTMSDGLLGFDVQQCNEVNKREIIDTPYTCNALLNASSTNRAVYPLVFDELYAPIALGRSIERSTSGSNGKKGRDYMIKLTVRSTGGTIDDSTIVDVEVN